MTIDQVLDALATDPDSILHPPCGLPEAPEGVVPPDVLAFYSRCGGAVIGKNADYPFDVVSPRKFLRANPVIIGDDDESEISHHWFVIATDGGQQHISIDCHRDRLGRCYDSFWETHTLRGDSPIIALTFTELLQRLVEARGKRLYWIGGDFAGYGDAYDDEASP